MPYGCFGGEGLVLLRVELHGQHEAAWAATGLLGRMHAWVRCPQGCDEISHYRMVLRTNIVWSCMAPLRVAVGGASKQAQQ
jgi:hypothetical protein